MRGLSRADIVDVAVAIADAEGTEAVSMRRIARDLRVGAMSLYWHVESKEELHQLMLDTVQAEIEAPARFWQTETALFDAKEPGVFDCRLRLCGHKLTRELAQPGDLDFVKTRLSRRYRARHRFDDFRNPTHSAAPRPSVRTLRNP
jgi:AcrR family transcriptional regulator